MNSWDSLYCSCLNCIYNIPMVCLYIWRARSTYFQITCMDIFPLCWNEQRHCSRKFALTQQMRETQVQPLGQEDPLRRKWQPTPVFLPGKSHGWRSMVGYSPWGSKESDTTEWFHFHFLFNLLYCPTQITTRSKTKVLSFLFKMKQWISSLKSISYNF